MAKEKQYVFSARTTEKGLRILNDLKARLGISWDELVIDSVCAHHRLDRADIAIPKDTKREEERAAKKAEKQAKRDGEKKAKTDKRAKALKERQAKRETEKKAKAKTAKKTGKKG